jgi:hypothetical protein
MTDSTDVHGFSIPSIGQENWGDELNAFFDDQLEDKVILSGPIGNLPAGGSTLQYFLSDGTGSDSAPTLYLNKPSGWEAVAGGGNTGGDNLSFTTMHSRFGSAYSNKEIHRFKIPAGSAFELQSLDFRKQGGGATDANYYVRVYDTINGTVLDSTDLNTISTGSVTSATGVTLAVEVTTGSTEVDASITVRGQVV